MKKTIKLLLATASVALLTACGGGGGGGGGSSAAAPTIALALSSSKTQVNSTVTLNWSTQNATSCSGADGLAGANQLAGSLSITPKNGGQYKYSITCVGTGGTVTQVETLIVPYVVHPTSYENKNLIPFDQTQIPTIRSLGIGVDKDEQDSNERSVTFGDFFQEGKISAYVSTTRNRNLYGIDFPDSPGKSYFLSKNSAGRWVDRTTELINNAADRDSCVSVSYAITADFNNDGMPDVFLACNGVDYDLGIPQTDPKFRDIYLSYPVLYLSQVNRTYKKVTLPYQLYGHQATAADIDRDGNVDIIITNQGIDDRIPLVLLGKGDGSFLNDTSYLDRGIVLSNLGGLYQVQIIPIDGRLDLVFGYSNEILWVKGKSAGGFDFENAKRIAMPISNRNGVQYSMPLDIIYINKAFYFNTNTYLTSQSGAEWVIIKVDSMNFSSSVIPTFDNYTENLQAYSAQIKPTSDGFFVAYTGGCNINLSLGMCGMRIKQ